MTLGCSPTKAEKRLHFWKGVHGRTLSKKEAVIDNKGFMVMKSDVSLHVNKAYNFFFSFKC